MTTKFALYLIVFLSSHQAQANDCLNWFLQSGLAPKEEGCELKCLTTPIDMGSFSCASSCEDLCSKTITERVLTYVPRLTEGDKVAIAKMPYEALKVFIAKERINNITINIFKKPSRKDESDAFRHFTWSALLAKEIGVKKARIFLNAHEEDSTQSQQEKKMDLINNDKGLQFFIASKNKGLKLELIDIEREALSLLRQKKLKVIKPRLKTIPGGYYSK